MYISKTFGLMPRITLIFLEPILNYTSTTAELLLTEFNNCGLLMLRNGFPNRPKHNASRTVDLPAPFSPMIRVVGFLSRCISVKLFPVERKFFHLTYLKVIKVPNPAPRYKETS